MLRSLMSSSLVRLMVCGLVALSAGLLANAQPVLITAPQTVGPEQTTITPTAGGLPIPLVAAEIIVRGTTLTMNGRHQIASLVVEPNGTTAGVVTHSNAFTFDYAGDGSDVVNGLHLTVSGDVAVAAGAWIDMNGRGFGPMQGPGAAPRTIGSGGSGGGGHGANGGSGSNGSGSGGIPYGSFQNPTDHGSGGGTADTVLGGAGGGVCHLDVAGELLVDGAIRARGLQSVDSGSCLRPGGGAGGSIVLSSSRLSGLGFINADGGDGRSGGCFGPGGGGSGGRIKISTDDMAFEGLIVARGGISEWSHGGAGTIYFVGQDFGEYGKLVIDQGGRFETVGQGSAVQSRGGTPLNLQGSEVVFDTIHLLNGARVSYRQSLSPSLTITAMTEMRIDESSMIYSVGQGYPGGQGPGTAGSYIGSLTGYAGGAGHGGRGGNGGMGVNFTVGGPVYGDATVPLSPGSGGGNWGRGPGFPASQWAIGGSGGGAIKCVVYGVLELDGLIDVSGSESPQWGSCLRAGGGSGGSVVIVAESLNGSGTVRARGGNGAVGACGAPNGGGGGGGGRIAIYSCDATLTEIQFVVNGGSGGVPGQPGTIYFGSSTVTITQQPENAPGNPGDDLALQTAAVTSQPDAQLQYQWRKRNDNGVYIPLTEDQGNGRYTGVNTPTLSIASATCGDSGEYDCLVTDSCGSFPTQPARVIVDDPADYNDDGVADILDILDFIADFDICAGLPAPCGVNGNPDFNSDGVIDILDLLDFISAFDSGC